jgi:cytochrome P450
LLGHVAEFRRAPVSLLLHIAERHPEIARIRLGLVDTLVLSDPALVHEVLVEKEDAFVKPYASSLFARPLFGRGLLVLERDEHRRRRRLLAPPFMSRHVAGYAHAIVQLSEASAAGLAAAGDIDMAAAAMRLTLQVALKTLFASQNSSAGAVIERAFPAALNSVVDALFGPLPLPYPFPTPANLRLHRAVRELDEVVYRLISEHRAGRGASDDLLSLLLRARDEKDGAGLSDREVRDEVLTMMLAGHETTANALSWTLYALARAPEARARVEAELDRVSDPVLGAQHRSALPWTLQVIKESMRLYPPVYLIARRVARPVQIGSYRLERGTGLFINIAGMHRRPDLYPEPERFDPDRFSPEREKRLPKLAYLPFAGGPRVCLGNHFALMEAQLILATWLRRLRFDLIDPGRPAEFESFMVLRPKNGLPMRVSPRRPQRERRYGGQYV